MNRVKKKGVPHFEQLTALKRIEGQVRGVQKMVAEERYCVDILNTISAIKGALRKIESEILKGHLDACVKRAFTGRSNKGCKEKLDEIYKLFVSLRK